MPQIRKKSEQSTSFRVHAWQSRKIVHESKDANDLCGTLPKVESKPDPIVQQEPSGEVLARLRGSFSPNSSSADGHTREHFSSETDKIDSGSRVPIEIPDEGVRFCEQAAKESGIKYTEDTMHLNGHAVLAILPDGSLSGEPLRRFFTL
jgi:hypothetical protein